MNRMYPIMAKIKKPGLTKTAMNSRISAEGQ